MKEGVNKIKNFAIIAHIDHGKSTLADRFLEITETVPKEKLIPQYLDRLSLEREKGITIKMQPVRMKYKDYVLNLIDTPGHCDFAYEVSRALYAVEGVILLIDGTQGIQAQTISNLNIAKNLGLKIIPAINKIDLQTLDLEKLKNDIDKLLDERNIKIHLISAKLGIGIKELLEDIIETLPTPKNLSDEPLALIFDSHFDEHRGIIAHIRIFGGIFKKGETFYLKSSKYKFKAIELGYFTPELSPKDELISGEIGYIATGIKEPGIIKIGDSIVKNLEQEAIPGYQEPQPVIFASIFPYEGIPYEKFKDSIWKLSLNDPAVKLENIVSPVFGRGYLIGCLGLLHLEIFQERLKRELNTEVILTMPTIKYKVILKNNEELFIQNPKDLPDFSQIKEILEPWAEIEIYTPLNYIEDIYELIKNNRGIIKKEDFYEGFIVIKGEIPLNELISGFFDKLKSLSSGYASLNYKFLEYRPGDLVKLDILIAEEVNPSLSRIVPRDKAQEMGRKIVQELKKLLPREQFPIKLQAAIGGKIIARETIPALKADVAGWLYGGDITRKIKLWQKQKKGKKKLQRLGKGKVKIPNEVLIKLFKIS